MRARNSSWTCRRFSREHTLVPRPQSMTSLDRLESALQSPYLPLALLLIALSTVFVFGGDRGYFYRGFSHNWTSSHHLTVAVNLSPEHGFQRFDLRVMDDDGAVRYFPYNRFPIGGYLLMKAATLPSGGSLSVQLYAARILMLLFFAAAAVLAYLSLCRLTSTRWIALTATLLAFSSYYLLYYNDMTANEGDDRPLRGDVGLPRHDRLRAGRALPSADRQDVHRTAAGMARLGSTDSVRHRWACK